MGELSPFFRSLPLEEHGLQWVHPRASVAHPLDDRPAVLLWRSIDRTAEELGVDGAAWRRLLEPLLRDGELLLDDTLGPLGWPRAPLAFARFGMRAAWPATWLARAFFRETPARALFAGNAAHSIMPLSHPLTSAFGVIFAMTAHRTDWPVARGGSAAITNALAGVLRSLGGEVRTGVRVRSLADVPPARVCLFDTDPAQLSSIAGEALPAGYRRRLRTGPADGSGAAQSGGRRREATRMPLRHCHLRRPQAALEHRRGPCRLPSRRLDPNDAPYPRHGSSLGLCSPWFGRRRPHAAAAAHPATGSSALRRFGSVAQRYKPPARRRLRRARHLQSAPQWAPGMCCPAPSPGAPAHRLEQPATAALAGRSTAFARAARASAFAASHGLCTAAGVTTIDDTSAVR